MSKRLKKSQPGDNKVRRQKTQTCNVENGVHTTYEPLEITSVTTPKTRKVVPYQGFRLDPKLTFWIQIRPTPTKAGKVTALLNIGGPIQSMMVITDMIVITDTSLLYGNGQRH